MSTDLTETIAAPTAADSSAASADDGWRVVRIVLLATYAAVYVVYVWKVGLPIARIAVLFSVAPPVLLAQVGKPWRAWLRTIGDLAIYAAMWLAYDRSRGFADAAGFPLQVQFPAYVDRFLAFNHDPNVWMQDRFYHPNSIRWYDVAGSLIYFTHFLFPVAAAVVLWIVSRRLWVRYMRRFATVLFAGVATYIVLPTAPPWMASSDYHVFPELARPTGRGWTRLHLRSVGKAFLKGAEWSNPTAALPSLHAAFALFVPLFFFTWVRRPGWRALMLCFPVSMGLTLVYFGEHYVTDILLGWLYVAGSFAFWNWWEAGRTGGFKIVMRGPDD